jgi:hypothetical protein
MLAILRDTNADGSVEVWAVLPEPVLLAAISGATLVREVEVADDGEPDYPQVVELVVGELVRQLRVNVAQEPFLRRAVTTFVSPGPPYEDADVSFTV